MKGRLRGVWLKSLPVRGWKEVHVQMLCSFPITTPSIPSLPLTSSLHFPSHLSHFNLSLHHFISPHYLPLFFLSYPNSSLISPHFPSLPALISLHSPLNRQILPYFPSFSHYFPYILHLLPITSPHFPLTPTLIHSFPFIHI